MNSTQDDYTQIDYLPSLRDIVMTLWRHRTTIITTMVVIILLGSIFILFKSDMYESSVSIMIKDNSVNLQDFKEFTDAEKFDTMTISTEVKVLTSPTLALRTIEATKLYEIPEFSSSAGDAKGSLSAFQKNLSVSQQGETKIVQVSFKSKDPELAAKIANAHVDSYFESQIEGKTRRVEDLSKWFQGRVKILKEDVVKKSRMASEYRNSQKLVVDQDDQELIYQQINEASAEIGTTQTEKLDIDAKLSAIEALKDQAEPDAIAAIINSGLIQRLKGDVSNAAQEVALLRGKFGSRHPAVLAANHKHAQAQKSLRDETSKIKETLKSDSIAAQAEIDLLQKHVADLEKQASEMRAKAIVYEGLRLEEKTSQKLLDSFLASYETLQSQNNLAQSDAVIVSPAVSSSLPAPPGKKLLLIAVIAFSGFVALSIVLIMEVMRGGIRNFEDVRKQGYKPLGVLPYVMNPILTAQNSQNSGFREALKRIYSNGIIPNKVQSLLISSAMPKEGRTSFTLALAYYMTSIGHKVIVVDTDFLSPSNLYHRNPNNTLGLSDYLTSNVDLSSVITTDNNGVSMIHTGSRNLPSPDILNSARFTELLKSLKNHYTYILIDSSPMLAHSEAAIVSRLTDGVIVVAEWAKTSQHNISNMAITLKQLQVNVLGLVLNKVDIEKYKTFTAGSDFLLPNLSRQDSN